MSFIKQHFFTKPFLQWVGFTFIAISVVVSYSPSFKHFVRADSFFYLNRVAEQRSFSDLVFSNYDFTRKTAQVDFNNENGLFRPLLYALLGVQKYFFGYNFYLWHVFSVFLHLLVVFVFLKICLEWYVGVESVIFTWLFALFYPNIEFVIWENISPYILAAVMILVALYQAICMKSDGSDSCKRISLIVISLMAGVFIYESLVLFSIVIFFYLRGRMKSFRNSLFAILLPAVLYLAASFWNYCYVNHLSYVPVQRNYQKLLLTHLR